MRPSIFISMTILLICAAVFSGCGGGKGGNGGSTSDYTLNLTIDPKGAGAVSLDPSRKAKKDNPYSCFKKDIIWEWVGPNGIR